MHALAFLLGSRALDLALSSNPDPQPPDDAVLPLASTPETAAAWRQWRLGGAVREAPRRPKIVSPRPVAEAHPG